MSKRPRPTANDGVLRFLRTRARAAPAQAPIRRPDDARDPYMEAGSHPECVERVWDQLGAGLPPASRVLVFGTPALIHPASQAVLAFALGTAYVLRAPRAVVAAKNHGRSALSTAARWTGGGQTDLAKECGPGWTFGSFAAAEAGWVREAFDEEEEAAARRSAGVARRGGARRR